ncbi:hypothetical protein KVT40_001702 [Elsinoe batatas]|uniref:Uncharacterized protein n=1 Tax=Elsinoe batatas TaxID=2601811 RepID=A0A8K0LD82_9PEZI|nr:hypothetical protein KVT40_001702 [Elsinoe batatas]
MDSLSKEEANDLLKALLTNLRNTLATFGPDSPQAASVKETVRAFLLSMRAHGIETELSRSSLEGGNTAAQGRDDAAVQGSGAESMEIDAPSNEVDQLVKQLMSSMKLS